MMSQLSNVGTDAMPAAALGLHSSRLYDAHFRAVAKRYLQDAAVSMVAILSISAVTTATIVFIVTAIAEARGDGAFTF